MMYRGNLFWWWTSTRSGGLVAVTCLTIWKSWWHDTNPSIMLGAISYNLGVDCARDAIM